MLSVEWMPCEVAECMRYLPLVDPARDFRLSEDNVIDNVLSSLNRPDSVSTFTIEGLTLSDSLNTILPSYVVLFCQLSTTRVIHE